MLIHPAGRRKLRTALKDLMRWLDSEEIGSAIIGGIAVSIRGRPRLTHDIDAVVLGDEIGWERVVESAARHGFVSRTEEDLLDFAARSRVLLLRHRRSGIDLDVSLGGLPFEYEMVERSSIVDVGSLPLRIVSAEDLLVMKALARREKDMADIEGILEVQRNLDLDRVRRYLREFSSLLEMPEIHDDFERLVRASSLLPFHT